MPTRRRAAAALRSENGSGGENVSSPELVAAGHGEIADRIIEAARAAAVPIREDRVLAEALAALELGSDVPPELQSAVAAALVWAYRLANGKTAAA